jgi:uncharacterized protein (TIGR02421 family)
VPSGAASPSSSTSRPSRFAPSAGGRSETAEDRPLRRVRHYRRVGRRGTALATKQRAQIGNGLIDEIAERLGDNKPVRRTLPDGGRIHIDRQLPFLVVYRPPANGSGNGTARFVTGEASYLVAPADPAFRRDVSRLAAAVAETMIDAFGAFLVIEVWSGPADDGGTSLSGTTRPPGFRVVVADRDADSPSVTRFVHALDRINVLGRGAEVELVRTGKVAPPSMPQLARGFGSASSHVRVMGVEVRPIHRNTQSGGEFPEVARLLHRQLSRAMQQAAYEFAVQETAHRPRHYQALGRRAFVKAVAEADGQLARVASAFDLLLLVSPVNTEQAYRSFRRSKMQRPPQFRYRPIDVDPARLKRALYKAPIEKVEDPTLGAIFAEKQRELSLKLDLLSGRLTPRFVHTGVALYGDVDDTTVATAQLVLDRLDAVERQTGRIVDARVFAAAAQDEIDRYRHGYPGLAAEVHLRDDVASLMVSGGHLLIGAGVRIPQRRVDALLQHEVGTHVVTYWNGSAQRLKLLATGLSGHDELQEGLAVLAEYLVAGLTPSRLRTVAARVVAARAVLDGADFIDIYRTLGDAGFSPRSAFQTTVRVWRGGGFVKDAVYLRGLQQVADYLADGGRIDTLLAGKISVDHVAVVEELQRRGVLTTPPLRPAYLDQPDTHYRMERLRRGLDLVDLAEPV